mgnify:CR=1 FL=1
MQKKQILYIALGLFLMLFLLFGGKAAKAIIQPLIAPAPAERHSKAKARNITLQANDYVLFGSYQGEPILWQVLRIQEGKPLLWSSRILCFKAFDAAGEDAALHRGADFAAQGSNRWADSSLRQWLNCVEQEVPWSHCPPAAQNVLDGLNPICGRARLSDRVYRAGMLAFGRAQRRSDFSAQSKGNQRVGSRSKTGEAVDPHRECKRPLALSESPHEPGVVLDLYPGQFHPHRRGDSDHQRQLL